MPILTIILSGAPDPERSRAVAQAVAGLTAEVLRKNAALTSVAVSYVAPEHWHVGAATLAEQGRTSFFLDVRVTAGTNTRDEKARFVAAVFARMREVLGDLHDASYVHVHEVPSDAWGYGGLTQAHRAGARPLAIAR
jgi:4-oxalocrotonate tautomerase